MLLNIPWDQKTYPCRPARTRARGEGSGRSFCRYQVDNMFTFWVLMQLKKERRVNR
jgi:hypothetical protein